MSFKSVLTFINILVAPVVVFLGLKQSLTCTCCWLKPLFCTIDFDTITLQNFRGTILRSFLFEMALYLFLFSMLVMLIRVFTFDSTPNFKEDGVPIRTLNRILSNTLEQTLIFVGLYVFFLYEVAGDRYTMKQLAMFAGWFIVGRWVFALGYLVGSVFKFPQLRAIGFATNMFVTGMLIDNTLVWHYTGKTYLSPLIFGK